MSVLRQLNILSQMRIDVPHLRSLESGVAADFDTIIGRSVAGDRPLVVRGFSLGNTGGLATAITVSTADGIVYNLNATDSGSFLWVPADRGAEVLNPLTNSKVIGSWTPGAMNYVGLDLVRSADSTTTDLVQFLDPQTLLEAPKQIPVGRTLDYQLVIGTLPFSSQSNVVPLATVSVDSNGSVTAVSDARQQLYRLGAGGDVPDAGSSYAWPGGRTESGFTGGDKGISSQKEWHDAIMTRLWELGGGEHWYSATADRNVTLVWSGAAFTSGEHFEWDGTNLHWKGLKFVFDNSTAYYNDVQDQLTDSSGLTNLADGECLYVDLDRTQNRTGGTALVAIKAALTTLGPGNPPGSRTILAYRSGSSVYTRGWRYAVGTTFTPATTTALGVVRLNQTPGSPSTPYVVSIMTGGGISVTATGGAAVGGYFEGGADGRGLRGKGGAGNAVGIWGEGTGFESGVWGEGGPSDGTGVKGTAGGTDGWGVQGESTATGYGVLGTNSGAGKGVVGENSSSGIGVLGTNIGTGVGVKGEGGGFGEGVVGFGGASGGTGVYGTSNGTNGIGVIGEGKGTQAGVLGFCTGSGPGVLGNGNIGGSNIGVQGIGGAAKPGVKGDGGSGDGVGVLGYGDGVGAGVFGDGSDKNASVIAEWNGTSWSLAAAPANPRINGVWGHVEDYAWAVCDGGEIYRYNGATWSTVSSGVTENLNAVWGFSSSDAWAVGDGGTAIHWNSAAWSSLGSTSTTERLNDIWGTDSYNVWAVGNNGVIRRWNGSAWSTVSSGVTENLNAVWGTSLTNVYAVGDNGVILHWNGTTWNNENITTGGGAERYGGHFNAVWGTAANDIWVVGNRGFAANWNAIEWEAFPTSTTESLNGVWSIASTDVWAVGNNGVIRRWNGSAWGVVSSGTTQPFKDVWGDPTGGPPVHVWAVGGKPSIGVLGTGAGTDIGVAAGGSSEIGYANTRTRHIHITVHDFFFVTGGTVVNVEDWLHLASSGANMSGRFRVRIPGDSTITGVKVLALNDSGASRTLNFALNSFASSSGSHYNLTQATAATSIPDPGSPTDQTWHTVTLSKSLVVPEDGYVEGVFDIATTAGTVLIADFRISYTQEKILPAV